MLTMNDQRKKVLFSGATKEREITKFHLGDIMAAELLAGGEVPLPRVGKLLTKTTPAHKGRNPKTGEAIDLPARRKLKLHVAKGLKESLN